jgi:hypothetical protein
VKSKVRPLDRRRRGLGLGADQDEGKKRSEKG